MLIQSWRSLYVVLTVVCMQYFASGGGFSNYFDMLGYQKSTVDAYGPVSTVSMMPV